MLNAPAQPHRWTLRSMRSVVFALWPFSWFGQRVSVPNARTTRVLLFSHHLAIGGMERMVLSLGLALSRDPRFQAFVFSHASDENARRYTNRSLIGEFLKAGIPVDAHRKGSGLSLYTLWRLARNIHQNRIDVIHTHDLATLIYAVLVKPLCLRKVKIVHTQHSFVHMKTHRRYRAYERWFTARADALSVVNESLADMYAEIGVPSRRITVVSNGVCFADVPVRDRSEKLRRRAEVLAQSSSAVRAQLEPFAGDNWILYMARLDSIKGQREALKVWRELDAAVRSRAVLVIVGPEAEPGERERIEACLEDAPARERIVLAGATSEPLTWVSAADVYLSSSKFEGMPLGPLEAIGSGLPAVLSAIPGHRFLNGVSLQYALESPPDGARRLEEVLQDPQYGTAQNYMDLWQRAEWVRREHSVEEMMERYGRLYAEATVRGRRPATISQGAGSQPRRSH